MSDHLSTEQLDQIQKRLDAANAEMDRLTESNPATAWRWSIPAQPDKDSDLVLSAPLADIRALLAHIDAQADQLWPIVATRNAALNRAEAAEQAIQRVRDLCMDTDGNYLENEAECNTVGGILEALDGGQE